MRSFDFLAQMTAWRPFVREERVRGSASASHVICSTTNNTAPLTDVYKLTDVAAAAASRPFSGLFLHIFLDTKNLCEGGGQFLGSADSHYYYYYSYTTVPRCEVCSPPTVHALYLGMVDAVLRLHTPALTCRGCYTLLSRPPPRSLFQAPRPSALEPSSPCPLVYYFLAASQSPYILIPGLILLTSYCT